MFVSFVYFLKGIFPDLEHDIIDLYDETREACSQNTKKYAFLGRTFMDRCCDFHSINLILKRPWKVLWKSCIHRATPLSCLFISSSSALLFSTRLHNLGRSISQSSFYIVVNYNEVWNVFYSEFVFVNWARLLTQHAGTAFVL